ncbi:putative tetratricopeptide repeat protein 41 [Lemur catta]|uniref:putative tetratricopeptide repeat protein 41 n=1 Tax=Lemur catta TaxID=9447 RepID=UPI001E26B861|nr:putative tetratricopeptide repeat protein 41 [Lemur catta]
MGSCTSGTSPCETPWSTSSLSRSMTEMPLKVQNALGELYLEIGLTQEGFQYFQKAWSNLLCFSLSDLKDSQNLVKQKAGQLLTNDSCHHIMIEAVGYLYRSLDLTATYLGSSHSSIHGILHILGEIKQIWSKRCWPQGMSQQYSEGSRNGSSLWEHLLKLNYHSAHSSKTVSSAMCMRTDKLQRAKSTTDLGPHTISDKSKCAKGKKILKPILPISAEEKAQRKTPNIVKYGLAQEKKQQRKRRTILLRFYLLVERMVL